MSGIRLSPQHGVNPSINRCFFCGEEKNELVLPGRLPGDAEAPRSAVWNMEPCDACAGFMEKGVILCSTRDGEAGNNPYRSGGWAVVTEDFIRAVFDAESAEAACRSRFAFIEDSAWDAIGIPRGDSDYSGVLGGGEQE